MPIEILDVSPVDLDGSFTSTAELDLEHDSKLFRHHDDTLLSALDQLNDTEIIVLDFSAGGSTHQVHVWDVASDGSLDGKWSRGTASSVSGSRSTMDNDVLVVAVPPGVSVPSSPQPNGPPAPGTTQKKIKVKIGPQGSLPFG